MTTGRKLTPPFCGPPPKEIPLPNAPLVRVIAQVRFPAVLSISSEQFIAPFQEAIRAKYPGLNLDHIHRIVDRRGSEPHVDRETVWRFYDETHQWRASLAKDFLALECKTYSSRTDFVDRLAQLTDAASSLVGPSTTNRIGVRYVSQIVGPQYDQLASLIEPDILGVVSREHYRVASDAILTSSTADTAEGKANFRWGFLTANATFDPDALDSIEQPSWAFDIDVATTERRELTRAAIEETSRSLAERCYAIFRSLVTDEFLRAYGGKI